MRVYWGCALKRREVIIVQSGLALIQYTILEILIEHDARNDVISVQQLKEVLSARTGYTYSQEEIYILLEDLKNQNNLISNHDQWWFITERGIEHDQAQYAFYKSQADDMAYLWWLRSTPQV